MPATAKKSELHRRGRRLKVRFTGDARPCLEAINFTWNSSKKGMPWERVPEKAALRLHSLDVKLPKALADFFVAFAAWAAGGRGVRFSYSEQPEAKVICNAREGTTQHVHNVFLNDKDQSCYNFIFSGSGLSRTKNRQKKGKAETRTRLITLWVNEEYLPADCIEIFWDRCGTAPINDAAKLNELLKLLRGSPPEGLLSRVQRSRHFVGREAELLLFSQFVSPHDSSQSVLVVSGPSGAGKTQLLVQFAQHCESQGVEHLFIDCKEIRSVEDFLLRAYQALGRLVDDEAFSAFRTYRERLAHITSDRILRRRTTVANRHVETPTTRHLIPEDEGFLRNLTPTLSESFVAGLRQFASRLGRLCIFVDTYNAMPRAVGDWFVRCCVSELPSAACVVLAINRDLGPEWAELRSAIILRPLLALTPKEVEDYLRGRGEPSELAKGIHCLSDGQPLRLGLIVDFLAGIEPELKRSDLLEEWKRALPPGVLAPLREWILRLLPSPQLCAMVEVCSVLRGFSSATIEFFLTESVELQTRFAGPLSRGDPKASHALALEFVEQIVEHSFAEPHSGLLSLHESIRGSLSEHLRVSSPEYYRALQGTACAWYRIALTRSRDEDHDTLSLELLHHTLKADVRLGLEMFQASFLATARYSFDTSFCEALIAELAEIRDEQSELSDWLDYARLRLQILKGNWRERREATNSFSQRQHLTTELRAWSLVEAGSAELAVGNTELAREKLTRAAYLARLITAPRVLWESLFELAKVQRVSNEWERAIATYDEAGRLATQLGDTNCEAKVLLHLGAVEAVLGRWDSARSKYTQALDAFRDSQDNYGVARVFLNQAWLDVYQGHWVQADDGFLASIDLVTRLGARHGRIAPLLGLAHLRLAESDLEKADEYLSQAEKLAEEYDYKTYMGHLLQLRGQLQIQRADFSVAVATLEQSCRAFNAYNDNAAVLETRLYIAVAKSLSGAARDANEIYSDTYSKLQSCDRPYLVSLAGSLAATYQLGSENERSASVT